jgi:aspartyl protease family protein
MTTNYSSPPHNNPPPPNPYRVWIWLGIVLSIPLLCWALATRFPEIALSDWDLAWAIRLAAVLALVSASLVFSRHFRARDALRNIAIWAAVFAVLALGYTFQDAFSGIATRLKAEFVPGEPTADGARALVLTQAEDGAYYATGEVNGTRVRFAIDTGATDIVLSPQDARRIGIAVDALSFDRETGTANGIGRSARITVDSLALGALRFEHVEVAVNQAPMADSLLGMAFLRRLKAFEFSGRKLTLRW